MSVVTEAGPRPVAVTVGGVMMSSDLHEAIERHLEGLDGPPTREIVAAICADPAATFHQEAVLRYFLLESPLRPRDLGTLLCNVARNRSALICRDTANTRERRLDEGIRPRWEGATTS